MFTIYDAAGSTTRFPNKEICHARQKLWIIRGPRGICRNGFVIPNTTLNSVKLKYKQRQSLLRPVNSLM
jgi:hypothetical protein